MEQDYFDMFMVEVERDLKKEKSSFVFTEEQVRYIKEKYGDKVEIRNENRIYYISLIDDIDKLKQM